MELSEHGLELLKEWEGFKNTMYLDSAGLPTIGVGHLLTKDENSSGKIIIAGQTVKWGDGLTDEQVLDLLEHDVEPAENTVDATINVALSQNQFDALVSFTFNVGTRAFEDSTLARILNEGNYAGVPDQLRRWNKAGGKVSQGLVNRRENEVKLWNGVI